MWVKSLFNEDDKKYFVRTVFFDNNDVPVSINIPNAIVVKYLANLPIATTEEEKEQKLDILFVELSSTDIRLMSCLSFFILY